MKKIKYLIVILACAGVSSCGIFKKNCNCPHFGKVKHQPSATAVMA